MESTECHPFAAVALEQIARAGEAIREDAGRDVREAETVLFLAEVVLVHLEFHSAQPVLESASCWLVLAAVAGVRLGDQIDPCWPLARATGSSRTAAGSGLSRWASCRR